MLKLSQFWPWEPIQADMFAYDLPDSPNLILSCRGILDFERPGICSQPFPTYSVESS